MALTLDIAADLERPILRQARRRGVDAKSFALALLRESLASAASQEGTRSESELLEKINRGFPADVWARYRELVAKRQAEDLEAQEHAELFALIDRIEVANAFRIECLAELASLRQVPLKSVDGRNGNPADNRCLNPSAHQRAAIAQRASWCCEWSRVAALLASRAAAGVKQVNR